MNEPLGRARDPVRQPVHAVRGHSRGNRPSFVAAAPAEQAEPLYERFCERAGARRGCSARTWQSSCVGDGPVTLMLEA